MRRELSYRNQSIPVSFGFETVCKLEARVQFDTERSKAIFLKFYVPLKESKHGNAEITDDQRKDIVKALQSEPEYMQEIMQIAFKRWAWIFQLDSVKLDLAEIESLNGLERGNIAENYPRFACEIGRQIEEAALKEPEIKKPTPAQPAPEEPKPDVNFTT